MVRIDQEKDIEALREVARLLDRENARLHERIGQLTARLARLQGHDEAKALELELAELQQLMARREKALTVPSHADSNRSESQRKPRKGHGPRAQPELPIEQRHHELSSAERICPVCDGKLTEMTGQSEDSEEITVVQRRFVLLKHRRQKYRCRCNASVVTAPGPPKLQPGARYSIEFAVEVAAAKFLDHAPLQRQARIMRREGLVIDSQTLWDQTNVLARHLKPSYEAIGRRILQAPLVHADETTWRFMGRSPKKRWYVWGVSTEELSFYRILDSRSEQAAAKLLADYGGIVMADGYSAYGALSRAGPGGFRVVNCWQHVRQRFVEIEQNFPRECDEILELISKLFDVDKLAASANGNAEQMRAQLRQQHSRPLIDTIKDWAIEQRTLPEGGLGKAIKYLFRYWTGLTAFLDDPRIPLTNNHAERELRGVVVGRKNHYGSRSRRGSEVAALFYTLFESAKLAGVEPKSYVRSAAIAAIADPAAVTLPAALPH